VVDEDELALGGAAASLRAQGYRWNAIAEAMGVTSVNRVRYATIKYALWLEARAVRAAGGSSGEPAVLGLQPT
jgi:hypothetical protein